MTDPPLPLNPLRFENLLLLYTKHYSATFIPYKMKWNANGMEECARSFRGFGLRLAGWLLFSSYMLLMCDTALMDSDSNI